MQVTIHFPDVPGFDPTPPITSLEELVRTFGTAATYTIQVRHALNPDVPIFGTVEIGESRPC